MVNLIHGMALSSAGMAAQAQRLRHVTENIANADTPGYRRKVIAFESMVDGAVRAGPVQLDPAELRRIHDPSHPLADAAGFHVGSNVDLIVEIADARVAQRSYEANLRMFDQTRQMMRDLIELLRR